MCAFIAVPVKSDKLPPYKEIDTACPNLKSVHSLDIVI